MKIKQRLLTNTSTRQIERIEKFIRLMPRYKTWRKAVFIRDKYKCVKCGQVRGWLEADHYPIPLSTIIREFRIKTVPDALQCLLLWDIDNGRTLCHDCHSMTPTYGKSTKNIRIWTEK